MAYTTIPGGMWVPRFPAAYPETNIFGSNTTALVLDADEEEVQVIGRVYLDAGSGSKTFGTSGSEIGWLPGSGITFADDGASDPTLRVGVKRASSVDAANGPPARATIGAAAFDVYDDLVGGTDTITATTWRNEAMSAGTPFTVNHGDLIAICWHLDKPGGAAQSVKITGTGNPHNQGFPASTLVTSGPTYASNHNVMPTCSLKFDDGTVGWLDGLWLYSVNGSFAAIGNTNLYGNIMRLPFLCKVDAITAFLVSGGTTNFDVGFWSDPLGTPAAHTDGTVSVDPQILGSGHRSHLIMLPTPTILQANTDYALAIKQNSATSLTWVGYDVDNVAHFKANGLDSTCYAAASTAGGAFAQAVSGKRRAGMWARISAIDFSTGGGLIRHPGMNGGLNG